MREVHIKKKQDLYFEWRHFQLEEAKNTDGLNMKIWDKKDLTVTKSLLASVCAESAKLQGKILFERFHFELLNARHNSYPRLQLNDFNELLNIAIDVGLDKKKFINDFNNIQMLKNVEKDHNIAVEKYGVFGTPTLVFENNKSVFIKTFIPKNMKDSILFFDYLIKIFRDMPFVGELKRPQPPWPKGVNK